ncbi:hypothetical protein SAMN02745244_02073 [Tessaracoccus bendigoensis DSM 12906]|uniref:Maltokinase N-terminal cap domain-containing protein n=1 Tax=Tessaracoccus bendigoensis DSM 12906 TaxID=1123357 RepID=A0A1M6HVA6_9ACTN|nr:hypothetical protein [Tessaracoccus bendigoensis]SHJ26146.1 hypothetical protein SAMN02745244_02073 [Tessaracoccus bendigoensis DSM 12906]
MAILHRATLDPTKLQLVTSYLDLLGWGSGPIDLIGGYRYDDPDGKVGVEGLIAIRGGEAFHIPVTYRDAPLEGAEEHLIATLHHSVLGQRWVYDATHDPVAVDCFLRALSGEQEQAVLNIFDEAEQLVEVRTPPVVVTAEQPSLVKPADLVIIRRLATGPVDPQGPAIVAEWADGKRAIVALG